MGKDKKILCNELIFGLMTNKIPMVLIIKQKKYLGQMSYLWGKY
jgi:hypothetical protein